MLDSNDQQYISQQFEENNKRIIGAIGELLEQNILPRLDGVEQGLKGVEQRLGGVEQRLDGGEQRLDTLERKMTNLPDKVYFNEKLADAVSDTVQMIERRIAKKQETERAGWKKVAEIFKRNDLAKPDDLAILEQLSGASS